ncbi:MAG: ferrochelatase, partial [Acidimicrobiia bacterium]
MIAPVEVAVLLMALGGPDSLDAVEPYLLDLRGGRPTSPELVEEIRERYAATGGRSPVLEITRELGRRLEERRPVRVVVGLRHWHPRIADAWAEIVAAGAHRVPLRPRRDQLRHRHR